MTPQEFASDPLVQAIRYLAGVCDGAARQDGHGFNKLDTDFGHSLAAASRWSPKQRAAAYRLARRYRRQLSGRWDVDAMDPANQPQAQEVMAPCPDCKGTGTQRDESQGHWEDGVFFGPEWTCKPCRGSGNRLVTVPAGEPAPAPAQAPAPARGAADPAPAPSAAPAAQEAPKTAIPADPTILNMDPDPIFRHKGAFLTPGAEVLARTGEGFAEKVREGGVGARVVATEAVNSLAFYLEAVERGFLTPTEFMLAVNVTVMGWREGLTQAGAADSLVKRFFKLGGKAA